jgi:hypothetical protein
MVMRGLLFFFTFCCAGANAESNSHFYLPGIPGEMSKIDSALYNITVMAELLELSGILTYWEDVVKDMRTYHKHFTIISVPASITGEANRLIARNILSKFAKEYFDTAVEYHSSIKCYLSPISKAEGSDVFNECREQYRIEMDDLINSTLVAIDRRIAKATDVRELKIYLFELLSTAFTLRITDEDSSAYFLDSLKTKLQEKYAEVEIIIQMIGIDETQCAPEFIIRVKW